MIEGGTEFETNKDRLLQRYAIYILYYSGDFVHQILGWALSYWAIFGKKWRELPNDSVICNTLKNGKTIESPIYVLNKLYFKSFAAFLYT